MRTILDSELLTTGFDVEHALARLAVWGYVTRAQRAALTREITVNVPCETSIEMASHKGVAWVTMVNAQTHALKVRSNGDVVAAKN